LERERRKAAEAERELHEARLAVLAAEDRLGRR
jgi:hypothetical protein